MNSKKRHLELLRKRYRLPVSLLTHEIPPGSPLRETGFEESADARGKVRLTGLVTCVEDARDLTNFCSSRGIQKLSIRYADYISLTCVDTVKKHLTSVREGKTDSAALKIVILNPGVPKEKVRLLAKLDTLSTKLSDVLSLADQGNTPQQRQQLEELRIQIDIALEEAALHADSAELIKKAHLDWLLLLELGFDAPPSARQEGLWLLKHMYPAEHARIYLDGKLDASALAVVRKRFQEAVIDREDIPSSANLHDARRGLLGAVGRHHLEYNLTLALGKACAVMDQYLKEEATKVELSDVMNSQLTVLQNLMSKRSLIGCRFIELDDDIDDDTESDDTESDDSGHGGSILGEHDPTEYEDDNIISSEDMDDNDDNMVVHDEDGDAFLYDDEDGTPVNQHSPCGSESSVNSPVQVEPAPKEETPISASSFVSSHSEIGDVDFARLLNLGHFDEDKYEDINLEKCGKPSGSPSAVLAGAPCAPTAALSPSSTAAPSSAPAPSAPAAVSASRRSLQGGHGSADHPGCGSGEDGGAELPQGR